MKSIMAIQAIFMSIYCTCKFIFMIIMSLDEDARERNNKFELPEDWIIPHTTQKIDYRDPVLLNKNVLINAHGPTFKPESTLGSRKKFSFYVHALNIENIFQERGNI